MSVAAQVVASGAVSGDPPALLPASLDSTFGFVLVGIYAGLFLYGIAVSQMYRYWRLYPSDHVWIRGLVFGIFVFETWHTIICVMFIYYHLVSSHSNPEILSANDWTMSAVPPVSGISILQCQVFYAVRVYRFEKRFIYRFIVGVAVIAMICSLGWTIASTIEGSRNNLSGFEKISWLIGAMFGFAMLADICLTGTLIVVLLRSRTGFKPTDSMLETLVIYAMNTGLLTAVVGLPCFVFTLVLRGNLIFAGLGVVQVKLYTNSVLAVLNSRRSLEDRRFAGFADMASFEVDPPGKPARGSLSSLQAVSLPGTLSSVGGTISHDSLDMSMLGMDNVEESKRERVSSA